MRYISQDIPDVKVDFVRASSYGKASESAGAVQVAGMSRLSKWSDFHVMLVSPSFIIYYPSRLGSSELQLDSLSRDLHGVLKHGLKQCNAQ